MPMTSLVPVEVYLRSSEYEPDAEYVDGVIEERPVGEYDHASWQQAIQLWFAQHSHEWGIKVRPELRVQVGPTRYRVPDVVVFDRNLPVEQILTRPPIAVFEILSPEDTLVRLKRKLADYQAMGIPQIWVIDPADGSCSRFQEAQLLLADQFTQGAISFSMQEITKLLDR